MSSVSWRERKETDKQGQDEERRRGVCEVERVSLDEYFTVPTEQTNTTVYNKYTEILLDVFIIFLKHFVILVLKSALDKDSPNYCFCCAIMENKKTLVKISFYWNKTKSKNKKNDLKLQVTAGKLYLTFIIVS